MIYIQSYHSGVVGPVQVRTSKKIPARESPERPLVCMPRWLSASVVTTALSLTVLLVCFRLGHDQCSSRRSVCMHVVSVRAVRSPTYFPTCKASDFLYARSRACNQSIRGIRLVTIQARPSDRDAGGAGASWPWPVATSPSQSAGRRYVIYTNQAIYHLP